MTTVAMTAAKAAPRTSVLDRGTAARLATTEYDRYLAVLRALRPGEWGRPTDCPDWDVRAIAGHVLGMAEMTASVRESARQTRAANRAGGVFINALTALQVSEHSDLDPPTVVERYAKVAPRAARARRRAPWFIRRRLIPEQLVGGRPELWTLGFLFDIVLTRDVWMHRVDTARAVGRSPELTADHDGVLVADVVAEWAERHGQPCTLRLTGPAGGEWSWGSDGPHLELDAVEFCRILSRRAPGEGLLTVEVPF